MISTEALFYVPFLVGIVAVVSIYVYDKYESGEHFSIDTWREMEMLMMERDARNMRPGAIIRMSVDPAIERGERVSLKPKDLLVHLEKGDRTKEFLTIKSKEEDTSLVEQIRHLGSLSAMGFASGIHGQSLGQMDANNQLSQMQNRTFFASNTNQGGIPRW